MKHCTALNHGLAFFQNGEIAPCCKFQQTFLPNYPKYKSKDFPVFKIEMEKIAQSMAQGEQDERCSYCWRDESMNIDSMRQMSNREWGHIDPTQANIQHIEIRLGNYCNLKCIMCWPGSSSSIQSEYLLHEQKYKDFGLTYDYFKNEKWWESEDFLNLFETVSKTSKLLHFTGGEPFLVPALPKILKKIENRDNINILFVTNMTKLRPSVLDLLVGFRSVTLMMSLEGVGPMNDYVRFPSVWSDIENNISIAQNFFEKNKTALSLRVNHTFQHTSVYSLPELWQWVEKNKFVFYMSPVAGKDFFHIDSVPEQDVKTFFNWANTTQLSNQNIKNFLETLEKTYQFNRKNHDQFRAYVKMLDGIRGTNFDKVFTPSKI
jgi:organic radical activating enzyme